MATKKRNTKPKTSNRKRTSEPETSFRSEVVLLVSVAIALILELSNFSLCGSVGDAISGFFFGLFGFVQYVLPILVFFAIAFNMSNKGNARCIRKTIYASLFLVDISVLCQMIIDISEIEISNIYQTSSTMKNGGGIIGGGLCILLYKGIGVAGTYIVVVFTAIIMIVLLTEKSFLHLLKNGSDKVYQNVKDANEERVIRKETLQQKRQEHKAKFEAEKLKVLPESKTSSIKDVAVTEEDVHEITMTYEADPIVDASGVNALNSTLTPKESLSEEIQEEKFSETKETVVAEMIPSIPKKPVRRTKKAIQEAREETSIVEHEVETKQQDAAKQKRDDYTFPPFSLLKKVTTQKNSNETHIKETAMKLQSTLDSFGVHATITDYSCGPAVTRFELQPEQGVKVSKIVGLADDIKLNLAAADIRIEAPIPGKAAVGIEIPNKENTVVMFRDLIDTENFRKFPSDISFAVGKDIGGQVIVTDIAKMPHLLIAGATGSGKSVCINTLIMSILYKAHPDDVKLIMIDPKVVELTAYNGIPHLLIPVVTDPKKAAGALNWAVVEMTKRYQLFADYNVRNLKGYNKKVEEVLATGEVDSEALKKLPQIIVIVDELADLMMVAHGEVEDAIVRLSQLARAAGIHLVIATQRPSVDVITGLIKANVPSRIAFAVASLVDSRTILDMAGAEKLLGKGDMLFYPTGYPKPVRVQGAFISDEEVSKVVDFLKKQSDNNNFYDEEIVNQISSAQSGSNIANGNSQVSSGPERDEYFVEAARFIIEKDKASIGMLQRMYKIGFNRAARIMDQLAEADIVGPEEGTKPRKILMSMEQFEEYVDEYL